MDEFEKLERVQDLFDDDQFEEGLALLRKLEQEYENHGEILFEIGVCYFDAGHVDQALIIFKKVEEMAQDESELLHESHLYRASALLELGESDEALGLLMEMKEEGDLDPRLFGLLGEVYLYEGLSEVAIGYFEKSLALDPEQEAIRYRLGEIYEEAGEEEKALAIWENISGLYDNPSFLVKRANLTARQGEFEEAKKQYEDILNLSPLPEALFGCGIVCYQMGDWPAAIRRFSQLIEVDPEYFAAYPLLGEALWELGMKDKAIAIYGQAHRLQEDDLPLLDRYLMLLSELGNWEKIRSLVAQMKGIDDEDPHYFYWKGRMAEQDGNIRDAIRFYQQLQGGDQSIHDSHGRLEKMMNL